MKIRIAFGGLRHGHILGMLNHCRERDDVEVVAICEEDAPAREALDDSINVTHTDYAAMLSEVDCDAVAVGDYYGKRGERMIRALESGRHAISDKPICTRLDELERIETLAREKGLAVGCMLDVRDNPRFRTLRRLVREGAVGRVLALSFGGQHPLMYGTRAGWYFEEGKHGGTINDIAIHAFDFIPWITGSPFATINSARAWNGRLAEVPAFQDCAQFMATLESGAGVLGDVSYLSPDSFGYALPHYWRTTFWGEGGVLEVDNATDGVRLFRSGSQEAELVGLDPGTPGGYMEGFLACIRGESDAAPLTTDEVLRAARASLLCQDAAETGRTNVAVA